MPSSFDIIADKVRLQLSQAGPDTPSYRILSLLNEMLNVLRLEDKDIEEDAIDTLKGVIKKQDETINNQARILQATKDALGIDSSKTMEQMPELAAAIYAQAQQWKGTIR